MTRCLLHVALVLVFVTGWSTAPGGAGSGHVTHARNSQPPVDERKAADRIPILVRPGMLAAQIGELAGQPVRVAYARVVGVLNPRVFLIDTATRLPALAGHRARVVVLVDRAALGVPPSLLVASTVTVVGTARTLLGMQVSREVAWPSELDSEAVKRLEVQAAVLATSVQTPEGVELTR